jgi:thioredoxin 1
MPGGLATSPGMSHSIPALTAADFRGLSLAKPGLFLVDFSAAWCPPCRVLEPVIVAVHASLEGRLAIGQIDCDVEQEITQRFGVVSMPTMLLFRDGTVVAQKVGSIPRAKLLAWLEPFLSGDSRRAASVT